MSLHKFSILIDATAFRIQYNALRTACGLESQLNVMFCEACCAASLHERCNTNKVVIVVALSSCTDECYKTAEFHNKYTIGEKIHLAFNEK